MQSKQQVVQLAKSSSSDSTVKSGALALFRGLRWVGDCLAEIPDAATQAASDIAEAWEESSKEESSRPNVK